MIFAPSPPYLHENLKFKIMKNIKIVVLSLAVLGSIIVATGFTGNTSAYQEASTCQETASVPVHANKQSQPINMFVTHGHCSLPFGGIVNNLEVNTRVPADLGNPLENMEISFEMDPNSFNSDKGDHLTAKIKTPGLFIGENDEKITFRSTDVYTMGADWYQVNGKMSIKGVERDVKFFVTGIKGPKDVMPTALVLEGQLDLLDWGIDYQKIVNGTSDVVPTKWMHLNMKIEMS
jgi:hypothetical protein